MKRIESSVRVYDMAAVKEGTHAQVAENKTVGGDINSLLSSHADLLSIRPKHFVASTLSQVFVSIGMCIPSVSSVVRCRLHVVLVDKRCDCLQSLHRDIIAHYMVSIYENTTIEFKWCACTY